VTHLSQAQLARKRENDREAQRNIRQRNKEHIQFLERKVKELQDGMRAENIERAKLEAENKVLRAQLAQRTSPETTQGLPAVPGETLLPQEFNPHWVPESLPVSSYAVTDQIYPPTLPYDEAEASQSLYTPTPAPMWEDGMGFEAPSDSLIKIEPAGLFPLGAFQPRHNFSNVANPPLYVNTTCWQAQPSTFAWQSATKLKPPVSPVDHLVMSVINSQRSIHSAGTGTQVLGSGLPSVEALLHVELHIPNSTKPRSTLGQIVCGYDAVLPRECFPAVPERLAKFVAMYRFVQWQIAPSGANFKAMYDWQLPQASQLDIPHPAWMDFPFWPKFRDKIIRDQARYDTYEFRHDWATNLSINFPYDAGKSVTVVNGRLKISETLEKHLRPLSMASMRKAFVDKYPEFRDACRYEEV
jgi:Domain of unknown function (DUF3425)